MIRLLLLALLLHASMFTLTSCTSNRSEDDTYAEEEGPIEDEEDTGTVAEGEAGTGTEAPADDTIAGEEATENELDAELQEAPEGSDEIVADGETPATVETDEINEIDEPTPVPPAAVAERARIRDIRFVPSPSGGSVVIQSSKPVTYQTRMNASTQQFVVEIADAELPPALQKPFPARGAQSRIGSINAYQELGSNTARVVIQLASAGTGEPIVQQEENSLVVIPPAAAPVARPTPSAPVQSPIAEAPTSSKPLAAKTLDEFLTGNQEFYGRAISLQVKDADVRDVINFMAEESGANIVMSDDVSGKISLKLRRVPWDQALVMVMRSKALGYVRQGNVLRISSLKSLQAETEATNKIIEAQKAIVPSVVQVIPISYADLDELNKNVTPFLTKEGKVVSDKRTSTLIVTDQAEVVNRVQRLVKTLDIAPAQVSIESKIVEASETFENFIGINWSFNGAPVSLGSGNQGPIELYLPMNSASVSSNFAGATPFSTSLQLGALDFFGDLTATLSLAERDSLAKVISSPRISAMNREKSTIRQEGENVTIISTRSEQTAAVTKTEKRTPFSLELSVTPQITAEGSVIMDLEVRREYPGPVLEGETGARAINKRSAKTKVLVRNGQTTVIGGIYTSDELEATTGIPGLKNIPIIGWLFKSRSFERNKNELLIFLTPRILAQEAATQTAALGEVTE